MRDFILIVIKEEINEGCKDGIIYKGYKIRLYPTKEQEELLWKHIHACRFIWNYMLAFQEENYKNNKKYLTAFEMTKLLSPLKNTDGYDWLKEVSNASLQYVCIYLDKAYRDFFKDKKRHPRFKSRKNTKFAYPITKDRSHFNDDNTITIPKIGKIKIKKYPIITGKIYAMHITYINNKWILSYSVQCENQTFDLTDKSMGIDLGVKELATVSYGDERIVFHNINKSMQIRTLEHKLRYIQHIISRKYNTNGNYIKSQNILKYEHIAKNIQYRLKNIRHNYIHQVTHKLIMLLPQNIIMEDLHLSHMLKNEHLSKELQNQCLYEFIRQMKYKCEWNGIQFIQADRYYPSSKTCSCCGNIKKNLKLSDRIYNCEKCGLSIDRDYNAAINLMRYVSHGEGLTA